MTTDPDKKKLRFPISGLNLAFVDFSAAANEASRAFQEMTLIMDYSSQHLEEDLEERPDLKDGCVFNAHSIYLQCTVNPMGNCQDCLHYQN